MIICHVLAFSLWIYGRQVTIKKVKFSNTCPLFCSPCFGRMSGKPASTTLIDRGRIHGRPRYCYTCLQIVPFLLLELLEKWVQFLHGMCLSVHSYRRSGCLRNRTDGDFKEFLGNKHSISEKIRRRQDAASCRVVLCAKLWHTVKL